MKFGEKYCKKTATFFEKHLKNGCNWDNSF